ncbi:type I DNA topoisomerase [Candidatus Woesebacteria bacterium]|nr:type I DNA topoisomerase [Candidatus Woesebacteria bacterium]
MNLVIVESPTKARKLRSYLGAEYIVEASVGHIRDLPKTEMGVDIEHNFAPKYVVSPDKEKVISILTKAAAKASSIILATDPDREGEAIAWHLKHVLHTVDDSKFKRATFHEITKQAVVDAINHPETLKMDLVNAQQARRVVDRLVGYEVSPVLWRKVRRGLSAGRVQSVALRMIVEREREIAAFVPEEYWEVDVALSTKDDGTHAVAFVDGKQLENLPDNVFVARVFEIDGKAFDPKQENQVAPVVAQLPTAQYTIAGVERKERNRSSLPPFTTSTLQQAAGNRLSMSSKQTMKLAQDLYEEGLITYHRTDAVNLSQSSITMARTYIEHSFGAQYLPKSARVFANASKNAQEAHEAIRVTDVSLTAEKVLSVGGKITDRHAKVYDLIWRRFLASQMPPAVYDQTTITVSAALQNKQTAALRVSGSTLKFDGWMRLFPDRTDVILPAVQEGQVMTYQEHAAAQKFTQPPPRYNDASLVKALEQQGIGRPSTYASIISVIEDRGYVSRDARRFIATPIGMTVCDFLKEHFQVFMEYEFTAEMEEDLDRVSRGEKQWEKVVEAFYTPFHKKIEEAGDAKRAEVPVEKTGEKCPKCGDSPDGGGEIVIRSGRFGKFKSCSRFPECDFTENIVVTVDGAVCPLCGQGAVIERKSRWGKEFFGCKRYPECDWASWKKPEPGMTITPEEWRAQQAIRKEKAEKRAQMKELEAEKFGKSAQKAVKKRAAPKKAAKKTTKKSAKK